LDSLDDTDVRPASAQVAFQALEDLCPGWVRIVIQQTVGIENHTRGAEAALKGIVPDEGLLKRVQVAVDLITHLLFMMMNLVSDQ